MHRKKPQPSYITLQRDPERPTIAQIDRASLPPALAMMVDYVESAPWEEVRLEVERQWPLEYLLTLEGEEGLEGTQVRAKLAGLILGVALGVTPLPHPGPTFPALRQALELARMTAGFRERKDREKRAQEARTLELRKARKAKRRASKRTR